MAGGPVVKFDRFKVLLGDGGAPEAFDQPCGFTRRSLQFSKQMSENEVPDCDDESVAAWITRTVRSRSVTISGTGMVDENNLPTWRAFWEQETSKNCQIEITDVGYWSGAFVMTTFSPGAERNGLVEITVEMSSDGAVEWHDV